MKFTFFVAAMAYLSACSYAPAELQPYLVNADSIAINYYLPGTNNVENVVIVKDSNTIRNFIRLLSESKRGKLECGSTGDLHFFDMNSVVFSADFSTSDSCNYITYHLNEKVYTTELKKEAKELLLMKNER